MSIDEIRNGVAAKRIRWTTHCVEKMGERDISIEDIRQCIDQGEIIEDYPDDFPHPSCLIYGKAEDNRVIHVVAGFDGETVYIITAYEPNTDKFEEDLKTRRK